MQYTRLRLNPPAGGTKTLKQNMIQDCFRAFVFLLIISSHLYLWSVFRAKDFGLVC